MHNIIGYIQANLDTVLSLGVVITVILNFFPPTKFIRYFNRVDIRFYLSLIFPLLTYLYLIHTSGKPFLLTSLIQGVIFFIFMIGFSTPSKYLYGLGLVFILISILLLLLKHNGLASYSADLAYFVILFGALNDIVFSNILGVNSKPNRGTHE